MTIRELRNKLEEEGVPETCILYLLVDFPMRHFV